MSPTQLAELDRVCVELDDLRPRAVITRSAWGECFTFTRGGRGPDQPHKLVQAGATPVPAPSPVTGRALRGGHRPPLQDLPADGAIAYPTVHPVAPEGQTPALLCPWCAWERQMEGHGSAPRTGLVRVATCALHSSPEAIAIIPSRREAAPAAPTLAPGFSHNPNAGVVQAFPKDRWS